MVKKLLMASLVFVILALSVVSAYSYYGNNYRGYDGYYDSSRSYNERTYGSYYGPQYTKSVDSEKTTSTKYFPGGYQKSVTTTKTYRDYPDYSYNRGYSPYSSSYNDGYYPGHWYEQYWESPWPRYYDNQYYSWEPTRSRYYYPY
jgi:hypothetical protein